MQKNNIKIICISATPGNVLLDAQSWGEKYHNMVIAKDNGTAYMSFKKFLSEDRVKPLIDIKKEQQVKKLFDIIENRWDTPKYHIIRASQSAIRDSALIKMALRRGYNVERHNSKERLENIEKLLITEPIEHTFILIKGFWRAAKTIYDKYIGVCIESTKDYTAITQGLGGRLLGYNRQSGNKAPLLFCDVNAVGEYVNWLENNANYLMCKKYNSSALKIKDGVTTKKKISTVHPDEVANLDAVDLDLPKFNKNEQIPKPTKIGIIKSVPSEFILATEYNKYTVEQFKRKFGITDLPEEATKLNDLLSNNGFEANVSYKKAPANSVSNLVNFYKRPEWAACRYHIIRLDDDDIIVITRKLDILNKCKNGDNSNIVVHNYANKLVHYKF
jgi:hypothetical protein